MAVILFSMVMTFLFSGITVFAESFGPRSPGFVSSQEQVGVAFRGVWVNRPYAMASDNQNAYVTLRMDQQYTQWLTAGNFGFSIPLEATIVGVEAKVERRQQIVENVPGTMVGGTYDYKTCLLINNTIVESSNIVADATPYYWPSTEETKTFGGQDKLWNQALTPSIVNSGTFGFAILPRKAYLPYAYPYANSNLYVDYMSMTVYYTMPSQGDTIPPVIAAQADITAEATSNLGAVVTYSPTATDNVDPTVNVVSTPASGSQFALGTTPVTYNATDSALNAATPVTFNVIVQDTTAPLIALNGSDPLNLNQDTTYTEPGATWTDAVDGTGAAVVGGDTVNTAIPGTYVVTYNYTDSHSNVAAQITRTVNVIDTIAPVITAQSNMTVEATSSLGAIVNFSPTATDNVDPTVNVVSTPASGSQFPLGTTPVTYNATDAAGNAAISVTFDVTVQDTTAPIITIIGSDPYDVAYGSIYSDPGATWVDAVDGTGNAVIGGDTVDTLVPGQYTVTYNYTDVAGNTATQVTRTVNVLPWSTINVAIDVLNWKGKPTNDTHIFTVQLNGGDPRNVSETTIVTYDRLSPGTYTITQSADAKYTLNQIIGDNDNDATNGATITVGSGETINLTFVDWVFQTNKK